MAQSHRKNVRKLVTLSPDLVDRLEKFREDVGAPSESDAIKILIEDGFKLRDKPQDLFARFEAATQRGETIGGIITLAADHPLIESAFINGNEATINLKDSVDGNPQKFAFDRTTRQWDWLVSTDGGYERWYSAKPEEPGGAAVRRARNDDLDDEIPF